MPLTTGPQTAKATHAEPHEIPFNYTSATDRKALSFLLGEETLVLLEQLRDKRVTGRSARLLMGIIGEILIHRRNPYLYEELVESAARRNRLFDHAEKDLYTVEMSGDGNEKVKKVISTLQKKLNELKENVEKTEEFRKRLSKELGAIVGVKNVHFDPFAIASHATDATDWRLFLPVAVVTPDQESQIAPLIRAISKLGLNVIPRGAGTGLTGGAVPLRANCVIINMEKMNHIKGIAEREFTLDSGEKVQGKVLELETGVITENAMEIAREHGLVFATDPTSEWSCTVGGNIAENAGGKKAVRWGTCIDNVLEWNMAMPNGENWVVKRTDHKLRKILHEDDVTYEVFDQSGKSIKEIKLKGTDVRKEGLWKDITNKALGGVPGLQKEGTDGVITSAVFVLYPKYKVTKTLCMEFFGPDMDEASRVIVELSKRFPLPKENEEALLALEHFDDEYIRAIDYNVKALRAETPKAVLLIDIAGNNEFDVEKGINRVNEILEHHPNTLMFVAKDDAEANRFWQDRKRLSAIARRTNAFKLNEDVVIPLHALAEFAEFIEDLNVKQERYSQLHFVDRILANLKAAEVKEDTEQYQQKIASAVELCAQTRTVLEHANDEDLRSLATLNEFRQQLCELVRGYPKMVEVIEYLYDFIRDRRIVIATHMHAGDGNVHVNIPVLSNDQDMMERADHVVDEVMEKVISLNGVVSGEHGIGVTKLKFLDKDIVSQLTTYRNEVDPKGIMNPGKLQDLKALEHIFTPSFNLLELEAHILKRAQIEELSKKVDYCIRCGKCKIDCCVFYPARGMFYHPRNKNLAIGSLIEALLYDAQREHSTDFKLLRWLEEVADHCTICHKCLKPCPVDIDTGEVSIRERRILEGWGYKHTSFMTKQTLNYLNSQSPNYNNAFRTMVVKLGGSVQRMGQKLASPIQPEDEAPKFYPLQMLRSAVPPVSSKTLRDALPNCEPDQVLVFEPSEPSKGTVFYFPGCGSERLNSNISMAAIHVLNSQNITVILPPPFLCCGFPAHVNAKDDQYNKIVLRNTVMFSQIREMFSYLEFDACVISCGTCMEGLDKMQADALFGGQILDVAEYLQEKGLALNGKNTYMYHAPCHDSLGGKAPDILKKIGGFDDVVSVPNCCSEAGTLALSRPDITDSMLQRKREAIKDSMKENDSNVILTNCPSCVQGLGRNLDIGIEPRHILVDLAEKVSGKDWQRQFEINARKAKAVSF